MKVKFTNCRCKYYIKLQKPLRNLLNVVFQGCNGTGFVLKMYLKERLKYLKITNLKLNKR